MKSEIVYVELKTGYNDNGPAWIGKADFSKTGLTIYFNGQAFRSCDGKGIGANYYDIETEDEYWISGVKKNQQDRHWAGGGSIMIDKTIVEEYLNLIGVKELDRKQFQVVELDNTDIRSRIYELENRKTKQ